MDEKAQPWVWTCKWRVKNSQINQVRSNHLQFSLNVNNWPKKNAAKLVWSCIRRMSDGLDSLGKQAMQQHFWVCWKLNQVTCSESIKSRKIKLLFEWEDWNFSWRMWMVESSRMVAMRYVPDHLAFIRENSPFYRAINFITIPKRIA